MELTVDPGDRDASRVSLAESDEEGAIRALQQHLLSVSPLHEPLDRPEYHMISHDDHMTFVSLATDTTSTPYPSGLVQFLLLFLLLLLFVCVCVS